MSWKPFPATIAILFAILAGVYAKHRYTSDLAAARRVAVQAIVVAQEAFDSADAAEARAWAAEARADSLAALRAAAVPVRRAIVAAAPDTCGPAIAALEAERDEAVAEAGELRVALAEQKAAAAKLREGGTVVVDAAEQLVKATRTSFLDRILPDVGVGGAVGISASGKPDAVIGITLSWDL